MKYDQIYYKIVIKGEKIKNKARGKVRTYNKYFLGL